MSIHAIPTYKRRCPEETLLYKTIAAHLNTFLTQLAQEDRRLPLHVEKELFAYLVQLPAQENSTPLASIAPHHSRLRQPYLTMLCPSHNLGECRFHINKKHPTSIETQQHPAQRPVLTNEPLNHNLFLFDV